MLYPNKTGGLFRFLLPSATWKVETTRKEVYLTFDDGPIPEVTEWVLDILAHFQIKGTFFCVGDNILKHPSIFEKVVKEGHSVGNHTFNHIKGWRTPDELYFENIIKWEDALQHTGIKLSNSTLFRPPYGQITFSQAKKLKEKYQIVMWDIITGDFSPTLHRENCLKKCIEMTQPGTVIVFHDSLKSKANLYYILPSYIEEMLKRGYSFRRLG